MPDGRRGAGAEAVAERDPAPVEAAPAATASTDRGPVIVHRAADGRRSPFARLRSVWESNGIPRPPTAMPRLWPVVWVTVLPMAMILATEYKFRQRTLDDSLSGSADPAVLVELAIYGGVLAYLLLFVVSPPQLRRPTAIMFLMRAYAVAMLVSVLYSEYPQLGAVRGVQLIITVLCAGAIAVRATRRQMLQLAHAYVALVTISVFVGLYYRVPFSHLQKDRFSWIYMHPVTAGAMLALGLVFVAGLSTNRNPLRFGLDHWPRPVYAASAITMLAALLGTQTRGAIGAVVAGLFVTVYLTIPRRNRLPLLAVGGLGAGLSVWLFADQIFTYLARGESTENLATVSNRTELWGIAFDLVSERPLTGWGLATSRGIFYDKVKLGGAHNALVNVLVDGGLIGASLWLSFVVAVAWGIRRLIRIHHPDGPLLAGILTTLVVNGLTVEGVGSGIGMSALWLLLTGAWVGVLQREVGRRPDRGATRVAPMLGTRAGS